MLPKAVLWIGGAAVAYGLFKVVESHFSEKTGGSSTSSTSSSSGGGSKPASFMGKACPNIDLPAPNGSLDFDGMPAGFRAVYEDPMKLTQVSVPRILQDTAAEGAEQLAFQAGCAGYSVAAQKLADKAKQIRAWTY